MTTMTTPAIDLDEEILFHLADPDSVFYFRTEKFSSSLIFDDFVKKVYTFQMDHTKKYKVPATAAVLEDEFDGFNETPILELEPPQTAVGDLVSRLRQRWVRYQGQKTVDRLADLVINDPLDVGNQLLVEGRRLADLTISRGDSYGNDDFEKAWIHYEKRLEEGPRPSMGFEEVDEHFGGMIGLTFLVGAKKSMKSWITINSALTNIAQGRKTYLYPLELPADETYWRLVCMAAGVPYWKYHKGLIMPHEKRILEGVNEVLKDYETSGKFEIEKPDVGGRGVQRMVEHALSDGAEVIYIDQLQYIEDRSGNNSIGALSNTGSYWEVCNDLRDYSDEVPLWICHQFNRSVMHNTDEFPTSQQGKGSSAIEETATVELGLWANKEMKNAHVLQIGTLESRNTEFGFWNLEVEFNNSCSFKMIGPVTDDESDE